MKEIIIQLKALGVIRFFLYYLLVALEFVLNLPYIIIYENKFNMPKGK